MSSPSEPRLEDFLVIFLPVSQGIHLYVTAFYFFLFLEILFKDLPFSTLLVNKFMYIVQRGVQVWEIMKD